MFSTKNFFHKQKTYFIKKIREKTFFLPTNFFHRNNLFVHIFSSSPNTFFCQKTFVDPKTFFPNNHLLTFYSIFLKSIFPLNLRQNWHNKLYSYMLSNVARILQKIVSNTIFGLCLSTLNHCFFFRCIWQFSFFCFHGKLSSMFGG